MKKLKMYLDTSVWNFYYAEDAHEKMDITRQFFEEISAGKYVIYSSAVVIAEIENADEETLRKLDTLISKHAPVMLNLTEEAEELADAYIIQGIIPHRKKDDALHIAVSTIYEMDALVS